MKAEYEHECSRAELLGLPKPIWDEFIKSKNQIAAEIEEKKDEVQIEEIEAESKRVSLVIFLIINLK